LTPCGAFYIIIQKHRGGGDKVGRIRISAMIDEEKQRRLFHLLVDERVTFSEWLRRQIDQYIEAKEPKAKRKGKGA